MRYVCALQPNHGTQREGENSHDATATTKLNVVLNSSLQPLQASELFASVHSGTKNGALAQSNQKNNSVLWDKSSACAGNAHVVRFGAVESVHSLSSPFRYGSNPIFSLVDS